MSCNFQPYVSLNFVFQVIECSSNATGTTWIHHRIFGCQADELGLSPCSCESPFTFLWASSSTRAKTTLKPGFNKTRDIFNLMIIASRIFQSEPAKQVLCSVTVCGEAVMCVFHWWILIGVSLPRLSTMQSMPLALTYSYLLQDLSFPLLSTKLTGGAHFLPFILIVAHSAQYMRFFFTAHIPDSHLSKEVVSWAYSQWTHRRELPIAPALDVLLDTFCHTYCLMRLLVSSPPQVRQRLCVFSLAGIAFGLQVMRTLARLDENDDNILSSFWGYKLSSWLDWN